MSLRTECDLWHQQVFDADGDHDGASRSPHQLVREKIRRLLSPVAQHYFVVAQKKEAAAA